MARARNIKPAFFMNEDLVELPFQDRLLFIGLWTLADREGRLEDRPKRIKMEVFPADDVDVDESLTRLASTGMLVRYEVGSGRYIQIVNFLKHQRPHGQEKDSEIPPFQGDLQPRSEPVTTKVVTKYSQGDSKHALIPDTGYLIPDTPLTDTPCPSLARKRADVGDRFDTWYASYPSKVGKKRAQQAFEKIDWRKVDMADVMSALEQHKVSEQWTKDGGKFIPHPATWLNGERWNDELKPARPSISSVTEPQGYSHDPEEAEKQMQRDLEDLQRQASGGQVIPIRRGA